jgi:hypothetical protein
LKRLPERAVAWAGRFYTLGFFVFSQVLFRAADLPEAMRMYGRLFHPRFTAGAWDPSTGPFYLLLDCLAVGVWIGVAGLQRRVASRATPAFLLLCGVLLLFLGRLGSGHFIYAGF